MIRTNDAAITPKLLRLAETHPYSLWELQRAKLLLECTDYTIEKALPFASANRLSVFEACLIILSI